MNNTLNTQISCRENFVVYHVHELTRMQLLLKNYFPTFENRN
jgi:hypothetical protein